MPLCRALNAADWLLGKARRLHPTLHAAGKFNFDIAGPVDASRRDFGYRPVVTLDDELARMDLHPY